MKRFYLVGTLCFTFGMIVMFTIARVAADTNIQGALVSTTKMEWAGQESHGPKTALKWVLGRQSDVPMETMNSFWLTQIGPGGFNKTHTHNAEEQLYYLLQGEGRMIVDGKEIYAKKGDVAYFPKGTEHGFYNDGKIPAILLGVGARTTPIDE